MFYFFPRVFSLYKDCCSVVAPVQLLAACDKKHKQRNAYQKAYSTSTLLQQLPINSVYTRKILRLLDYFAITQL